MQKRSEREVRIQKIKQLRNVGIIPFVQSWDKNTTIVDMKKTDVSSLRNIDDILASPHVSVSLSGRLMLKRVSGKLSFGHLLEQGEKIQLMWEHANSTLIVDDSFDRAKADALKGESSKRFDYRFVDKMLDVGDWIGVRGELFVTHKGELTIFVSEYQLLSKAVRPLGDKYHGIGDDQENAYRQRYLDMIFNEDSFQRMKLRSDFTKTLREFYWSHGFIELDTPILGNAASGAAAKPFVTHHEDFDIDMYLRIAPEIALKMATVGGLERVFEIGKDFRNEGSSPSHHQEFLVAEHYAVYRTYEDNMRFTEKMFDYLFDHIPALKRKVMVADKHGVEREIDFTTPWQRVDYIEQIKKDSGIDVSQFGPEEEEELRSLIQKKGFDWVGLDTQATATMIDYLYKKVTRPKIIGPAFIYNYPKTMQPLARTSDSDKQVVEQFQLLVNGWEILKAYSELVDPLELQENFDAQAVALAKGDEEATSSDDEFTLSMEYGMPPQSGRGMGIDRILAMLTEQRNIRDVIMFPMMKPLKKRGEGNVKMEDEKTICEDDEKGKKHSEVYFDFFPSIEEAESIADTYLKDTRNHCGQVARIMKRFAKDLGLDEKEQNRRYITGLLHDVDRDYIEKSSEKHLGGGFEKIMNELWEHEEDSEKREKKRSMVHLLMEDIRSHYDQTGVPVDSLLRKYLASVDELSGLIHAYSLMRPEGLHGMKWKSLNKKIKDKKFAAGVDREHVRNCEKYLGVDLSEFSMKVVEGMIEGND